MKKSILASMPFAHYLGLNGAAASEETDDDKGDKKQREGESDEDYAKRMKADEEKDKKTVKGDDSGNSGDDEDAEDEEDDKEQARRPGRAKSARKRERARVAAILAEGINLGNVTQACVFACDTDMNSAQAIAVLRAATPKQSARSGNLYERMAQTHVPNPGPNGGPAPSGDASKSLADRIVAAGQAVSGRK